MEELLFFDTFSHDINRYEAFEDQQINLDLVQFPNPVFVTECRIIPLGARVVADFPGGTNRLGATNPSKFHINLYVNDLTKTQSTFEAFGGFEYNQNDQIHIATTKTSPIPTDGLVLMGEYKTITLAVYGILTKNVIEPMLEPLVPKYSESPETKQELQRSEIDSALGEETTTIKEVCYDEQPKPKDPRTDMRHMSPESDFSATRVLVDVSLDSTGYKIYGRRLQHEKRNNALLCNQKRPHTPLQLSSSLLEERSTMSEESQQDDKHQIIFGNPDSDEKTMPIHFEPILSDEEIADDIHENYSADYDTMSLESVLETFDPYVPIPAVFDGNEMSEGIEEQITELTQIISAGLEKFPNVNSDGFLDTKKWILLVEDELLYSLKKLAIKNCEEIDKKLRLFFYENPNARNFFIEIIKIGLSINFSVKEPHLHLRHMKYGLQLVQSVSIYECIICDLMQHSYNIFEKLFCIYAQFWSFKYETLKTIYCLLDTKTGMDAFVSLCTETSNTHKRFIGYKHVLHIIEDSPNKRIMCFLKAILKKVHIFECLESITGKVESFCKNKDYDENVLGTLLHEIQKSLTDEAICFLQLDRFLPVSAIFSIYKDERVIENFKKGFYRHFDIHCYLESLLALLNKRSILSEFITNIVITNVREFLSSSDGLNYLIKYIETTNLIIKSLLKVETTKYNAVLTEIEFSNDDPFHDLGIEFYYKIQTECHLIAIKKENEKSLEITDNLHSLYSLTCGHGKVYVIDVLTMASRIEILFDLIEQEIKTPANYKSTSSKCKSANLNYLINLIEMIVRYCTNIVFLEKYSDKLLWLVKIHENMDSTTSAVLREIAIYLKPLEIPNLFSFDSTSIRKMLHLYVSGPQPGCFPGELIMALRIISGIGIASCKTKQFNDNPCSMKRQNIVEFKYFYVIKEFISADGSSILISILEKFNNYFEQPAMHAFTLSGNEGIMLTHILLPIVNIFNAIIPVVIQKRNTDFKDTTPIEILLKIYALMYYIPIKATCYRSAESIRKIIIEIILAYTQPYPINGIDTKSIYNSLWTHMISELIKFIFIGPQYFMPGLQVFSQLLPLSLPISTKKKIGEKQIQYFITERQLWSAHLHSQSKLMIEMIQNMCLTNHQPLLLQLSQVCWQLSDLAPNISLLVAKSILDLLVTENISNENSPTQLARILGFVANLTIQPSIKVSIVALMDGHFLEILGSVLSSITTSTVLSETQEYAHLLLQNLLDSKIHMISDTNYSQFNADQILACALPTKEKMQTMASIVIENFCEIENSLNITKVALQTLSVMTKNDFTFSILQIELMKKRDLFVRKISHIIKEFEKNAEALSICSTVLIFLISLVKVYPERSLYLRSSDLCELLDYPSINKENHHTIDFLSNLIEKKKDSQYADLRKKIQSVIFYLNQPQEAYDFNGIRTDTCIPPAEGIVTQFSSRHVLEDQQNAVNPNIYWFTSKISVNFQHVKVNLLEGIQAYLPSESIAAECKRLLNLSATPSNRDRTAAKNCFRTRRVEVEPTTGRPERKNYVSRGRSFSRGDIFRNRPANTSRPPSLHVDDFLALETGYTKSSIRGVRSVRGRSVISIRSAWYSKKYIRAKVSGVANYNIRSRGRSYFRRK